MKKIFGKTMIKKQILSYTKTIILFFLSLFFKETYSQGCSINIDGNACLNSTIIVKGNKLGEKQLWKVTNGATNYEIKDTFQFELFFKSPGTWKIQYQTEIEKQICDTFLELTIDTIPTILADRDSTCISNSTIQFTLSHTPKNIKNILWTFGDPNSGPNNVNFRTISPSHSFTGLGPFLVTLNLNHSTCGTTILMDTIIILGPQSVVDVPGDRIADWQIFQCPKDVMDTVFFRNNSRFYHNDLDYTDEDSTFYKHGTSALGHNFQKVGGGWVWIPPIRRELNGDGSKTVYNGSGPILPGSHNDPLKREKTCATRLWDFGDNFGSKCTTDVLLNKNVNVNCNFSRDSIPYHYYKSWDLILLSDFKMAPMEDARFIDDNGICIRVPVFPDSMFYILYDTLVYIPKNSTDINKYKSSKIVGNVQWGLEKIVKGKAERFMEFHAAVSLNAGNSAIIIKDGVRTLVKGPWLDTLKPTDIIILDNKDDSIEFHYTVYLKRDTMPYALYKIRAAKGDKIGVIDSFKRIPPGIKGYNYIINYDRFRSLFYARIPSCNNVRLTHKDTCHPMACESEANRQVVMMHANAGGVGSGLIKDAIECLGARSPTYGVTFDLSNLKPGCSFTEIQINYDTFCGNNWVSMSGLNPGGRPVVPPSPPPYWDGGGTANPNLGYEFKGNPGSRYSTYYMGKPCNDTTGCVTVGIIVGNGVAKPGGSGASRPLCADTHYYDKFACFPFIDPSFEIMNLVKNPNGDYKICKWDPIIAHFTPNNFTKVDDLMSIRWQLQTGNAGPSYTNFSSSFIQEDIFRNQKIINPVKLPNGKLSNPNYLYNYIVQTRGYEDPVQTPCSNQWEDGNTINQSGPDTIVTAEIRDFKIAADVSKVWDRIREAIENSGFDPFALSDTTIAKMIWNNKGVIGQPSTGAYGCIDTSGFGKLIRYYYIPNNKTTNVLHFRNSSITPTDSNVVYGSKVNSYSFTPRHAGRYILSVSMRSDNGECDDIAAVPLIVGFAMLGDLFTDSTACVDQGNSLIFAPDYRYFSTDPDNFGTWDPNYWNNSSFLATGYDYWKDPSRMVRMLKGDTNVERITKWDWSTEDDDPSNPDTYQFRGDYGATGGLGTFSYPFIQLGGGSGLYYHKDSGIYTFMNITGDSTGCIDTFSKRIFISRLNIACDVIPKGTYCNSTVEFTDNSELHDPCSWAMKNCSSSKTAVCDYISKWTIDWGDGTFDLFEKNTPKDSGLPKKLTHNYSQKGWFKITYRINTNQGCNDSIEKWINILGPRPKFEFSNNINREINICLGDVVSLKNISDSATSYADWKWIFGDGTIENNNNQNINHTYKKTGNYKIRLEQTDSIYINSTTRRYCTSVYPDTSNKTETFVVNVQSIDSINGYIQKSVIGIGDSNTFIHTSKSFDYYKWKIEHFNKALNQWVTDSIVSVNHYHTAKFEDPGEYFVYFDAGYDFNKPKPWCKTGSLKLSFLVDSSLTNYINIEDVQISIFPNPVTNRSIELMGVENLSHYEVVLWDMNGKKINTELKDNILSWKTELADGTYLLTIKNSSHEFHEKILILNSQR